MGQIESYKDLRVWQRALDLAVSMYSITGRFPKSEIYGLTSQMRRAAVSIASNIAEGHQRPSRDFARFLNIARGSVAELETQLEIARRIGYIPENEYDELYGELVIIGKQLNALLKRIRSQ